jgi:hypothetical protein
MWKDKIDLSVRGYSQRMMKLLKEYNHLYTKVNKDKI